MFCRNCGQELKENQQFCPNCGTPVVEKVVTPQKKQHRPRIIIGVILAIIALVAVITISMPDFVAGYFNDDAPGKPTDTTNVVRDHDGVEGQKKSEDTAVVADTENSSTIPDEPQPDTNAPASDSPSSVDTWDDSVNQSSIRFDTEFYSLELPEYWADLCVYDEWDIEPYSYGIAFYEKQSMEDFDGDGGFLFSIALYNDKDYMDFPDYTYLGELSVIRLARYDVVVSYPTDVQFSDAGQENYMRLCDDIAGILASFTPQPDVDCEYTPAT